MPKAQVQTIQRYDVRDPVNPMLNLSYKVDSWTEGNKSVLTLDGASLTNVDLPLILDTSTVYIVTCRGDEKATSSTDKGEDVTMDDHKFLGLSVIVYEDIKEEDIVFKFMVTAKQYIEIKEGDVIARIS